MALELALAPGPAWLIEVEEQGNDALVEILDSKGGILARADHPERRTGTRRAVLTAPDPAPLTVRITGKEHAGAAGTATIRAFDLAALKARPECLAVLRSLAQGDSDYASGQEITRGRAASPTYSAHDAYLRAADVYASAERALVAPADQPLRGQTQLALAEVEYSALQAWAKAAEWAQAAAGTLGHDDPYRRARAEALLAAAWLEIGSSARAGRVLPEYEVDSTDLLTRARRLLRSLSGYHLERGERYDAGLQLTNIGLTYLYQSRFSECIAASSRSSELFGSIHEARKRAQAWQNEALCLWGLGRLPEALRLLERARPDIPPEPYPRNFISVTTNTALVNYALGHFDESLRLYDLALPYARGIQSPRDEAFCLYGLGVNYYALGARDRAREFLERALAIRTVTLDGRGRMATLRALATIDADERRLDEALAYDREALALAVGPSSIGRIRIQLAVHTAAAGHPEEAIGQLTEVIGTGSGAGVEPVAQAEALLQRGVLYRQTDRPREALSDLERARPHLHHLSITEEFAADLELSRTLRLRGQTNAALAAVDRALGLADAVRAQTANPELRAQLQTPLRAAYDLRIELLRARFEDAVAAGRTQEANSLAAAAFTAADASRARSLADVAAQEYPPAIRQALASEFRHREALYGELAGRRFRLASLLDSAGARDPTARHLMADVAELERQIDAINTAIAARAAPQSKSNPMHGGSLPRLPAGTALVSYWLGSESAYAWVVLPAKMDWQRLPPPAAINQQALAFHQSLRRLVDIPPERRLASARALYELVVRPVEASLGRVRTWVIVPDGALDYVPFAALRGTDAANDSPVVAHHDVALTPAAWMLEANAPRARAKNAPELLMVADPVYQADDPRLAAVRRAPLAAQRAASDATEASRPELQRLPYTAEEAAGIVALFPKADVAELIGVNATRDRLLSLDWSRYRFIHIATHGLVDAQVPQLSALMLGSYDASGNAVAGAVRVADLSLRTMTAEVAVFSACETALGKEVPSEGLLGISSTVLARGARAVVASLWPVSDEMGARLMTDFYRHLLHDSMSPAAALGASMRSVVGHDASADPALWAAYQVSVVALGPGQPTGNADAVTATTTRP